MLGLGRLHHPPAQRTEAAKRPREALLSLVLLKTGQTREGADPWEQK